MEEKSEIIFQHLKKCGNNWEEVLFKMLSKNFGLNINGDSFLSLANSIPFPVIRKLKSTMALEALFFGQGKLLEKDIEDPYFSKLKKEYEYQKHKFHLDSSAVIQVKFFRLRPDNFPTIRLAQLAALYSSEENLFSKIISAKEVGEIRSYFKVEISEFWKNHYTFEKESKSKTKKMSEGFQDLLIINTIIPITFCFAKEQGKDVEDHIFNILSSLRAEKNSVVNKYNSLRKDTSKNALQSQALIHMKNNYCDANQCLKCNLGSILLS